MGLQTGTKPLGGLTGYHLRVQLVDISAVPTLGVGGVVFF